jgi:4-hydroxy-tetrahydrodipicolinate synthase
MSLRFKPGVYVALVTPFENEDNIDYTALKNLLDFHNEKKTMGVVLLGTTGESPTLSMDEKKELVKFVKQNKGNLDLVVGVGGNNTREVIAFTKYCNDYADSLMVTVPNYNKPMQDGIFQHFSKISESTLLPIMMYNIPSRCGVNMTYETIVKLYHYSKNIVAIKEASGDLGQIQDIMNNCDIDIFAGDDSQLVPVMALGGKGVVSVYANINPTPVLTVFNSCLWNQFETARTEYFKYHNKVKELFVKTNPIPVKEMMAEQGMINNYLRLPLM